MKMMQSILQSIKDFQEPTCCEINKSSCNQGRTCPVREGTHKPAEAVHQIQEPTVNQQFTSEREEFEKWLGIKPCGAAHDFGWAAWQARAALAATPAADAEVVAEKADPLDALRWGANVAETLLSIGRAIGFGRAQQILGEQWEAEHNCAPRGRMGVTVKDDAQSATPAAAPVVLPEPDAAIKEVMELIKEYVDGIVMIDDDAGRYLSKVKIRRSSIEAKLRALLATGGQAQAVDQSPVLYVSKGQLDNHSDPDGPDSANAGRYLPARITPAGNFTMPLFSAPQAQADARCVSCNYQHGHAIGCENNPVDIALKNNAAAIAAAKGKQ